MPFAHLYEPGYTRTNGYFYPGTGGALAIWAGNRYQKIQGKVRYEREGVCRIHYDRGNDREYVFQEMCPHLLLLGFAQLMVVVDPDVVLLQLPYQSRGQTPLLAFYLADRLPTFIDLFLGSSAIN